MSASELLTKNLTYICLFHVILIRHCHDFERQQPNSALDCEKRDCIDFFYMDKEIHIMNFFVFAFT